MTAELNHERGYFDIEKASPSDEGIKTETDKKMGIETPTTPSEPSRRSVEQVDNHSNFVFSSFHDLNLFVILQMEKKLVHHRKRLYDAQGLSKEAHGWTDKDTLELQGHLKLYRNKPQFLLYSNWRRSTKSSRGTANLGPSSRAYSRPNSSIAKIRR